MIVAVIMLVVSQFDHLGDPAPQWLDCPYGQQLVATQCSGDPVLMDQRSAQQFALEQAVADQLNWRLATANELKRYHRERLLTSDYQLLSSEHIAHGNEFMVITLNPQTGKLEYQPLHYRGLFVLIRDQ